MRRGAGGRRAPRVRRGLALRETPAARARHVHARALGCARAPPSRTPVPNKYLFNTYLNEVTERSHSKLVYIRIDNRNRLTKNIFKFTISLYNSCQSVYTHK